MKWPKLIRVISKALESVDNIENTDQRIEVHACGSNEFHIWVRGLKFHIQGKGSRVHYVDCPDKDAFSSICFVFENDVLVDVDVWVQDPDLALGKGDGDD